MANKVVQTNISAKQKVLSSSRYLLHLIKVTFSSLSSKFLQMTDYAAYDNISKAIFINLSRLFFTDCLKLGKRNFCLANVYPL